LPRSNTGLKRKNEPQQLKDATALEGKMIILWIRKSKDDKKGITREPESFQEHDDIMKRFRLQHPDITSTSSRDVVTSEGNLLAPVHHVKLAENIQN
jgi:hypothetical protein